MYTHNYVLIKYLTFWAVRAIESLDDMLTLVGRRLTVQPQVRPAVEVTQHRQHVQRLPTNKASYMYWVHVHVASMWPLPDPCGPHNITRRTM